MQQDKVQCLRSKRQEWKSPLLNLMKECIIDGIDKKRKHHT